MSTDNKNIPNSSCLLGAVHKLRNRDRGGVSRNITYDYGGGVGQNITGLWAGLVTNMMNFYPLLY